MRLILLLLVAAVLPSCRAWFWRPSKCDVCKEVVGKLDEYQQKRMELAVKQSCAQFLKSGYQVDLCRGMENQLRRNFQRPSYSSSSNSSLQMCQELQMC